MTLNPTSDVPRAGITPMQWCALALAFGVFSTLFGQYRYGFVNHLEQLPPILRALEPAALAGDETVDALSTFGPRHYYVGLIVALAKILPLPVVYVLLTLAAHSATALVTMLAARSFFRSQLAAMLAAALVASVASVGIGGAAQLVRPQLVPQTLATPFLLAALWMGLTLRPYRAVAFACAGCLFHPLAGTHTGLIALAICGLARLCGCYPDAPRGMRARLRSLVPILVSTSLLGAFIGLAWVLPGERQSYDLAFLLDFALFRSPHHHLPSHFSLGTHAAFACFTLALLWSWRAWYHVAGDDRPLAVRMGMGLVGLYVLLLCGYVFVEVLPTRTFLMAQTFRLVFAVKWLGLLLIAATAARMLACPAIERQTLAAIVLLAGTGPFQPAFALLGQAIAAIQRRCPTAARGIAACAALLASIACALLWRPECLNEVLALAACGGLIAWHLRARTKHRTAGALAAVAVCVAMVAVGRYDARAAAVLGPYQPVLTLADGDDPDDALALFVLAHTPKDAVILTPPYFGRFRIRAERGVVVDFKCMPYDGKGYLRWRERLADCYTEVYDTAERAVIVMKNRYYRIKPETIRDIAGKYGADYAVLYRRTPNDWPVLFATSRYKLVAIPAEPHSLDEAPHIDEVPNIIQARARAN